MNINLNGNLLELNSNTKLLTLLEIKGVKPEKIVIEYNYDILSKEEWENITLKENDIVEIINFVVGG